MSQKSYIANSVTFDIKNSTPFTLRLTPNEMMHLMAHIHKTYPSTSFLNTVPADKLT